LWNALLNRIRGENPIMNKVLLVIDMQKYFYHMDPATFNEKLIPNISRALEFVRSNNIPVIYIVTKYKRDKSDWPLAWRKRDTIWCLEGSEGEVISEALTPLSKEKVVYKTRYSGFYHTRLQKILANLNIDSIIVAGYSCDVCVRMTVIDAYNHNFKIYLLSDCVHSFYEDTDKSIEYLKTLTNLDIINLESIMNI
jgi:nicotinamidase-related amidase